ncbi:MAG: ATP-grasp domain-containing protein [bacterium]
MTPTRPARRSRRLRLHHIKRDMPPGGGPRFPGVDVWRWQYFEDVRVPRGTVVPVDDPTGWQLYPEHRRVYDKLFVCASQGLPYGPHGVMPRRFPVFSKPVMNLHGMGVHGYVVGSPAEMKERFTPGHLWVRLLRGRHISTDVAMAHGRPCWWRHSTGRQLDGGTFDYWTVAAERPRALERYLGAWLRRTLRGFTGVVNVETIAGRIIECHLRMAEQWLDLNGPGWLEAVVGLYATGRWRFRDDDRRTGYSVVLFAPHGRRYTIDPRDVEALRFVNGISSIQITFDESIPLDQHAMPPGGFRIAIVNCWDLHAGLLVRSALRRLFHQEAATRPEVPRKTGSRAVT